MSKPPTTQYLLKHCDNEGLSGGEQSLIQALAMGVRYCHAETFEILFELYIEKYYEGKPIRFLWLSDLLMSNNIDIVKYYCEKDRQGIVNITELYPIVDYFERCTVNMNVLKYIINYTVFEKYNMYPYYYPNPKMKGPKYGWSCWIGSEILLMNLFLFIKKYGNKMDDDVLLKELKTRGERYRECGKFGDFSPVVHYYDSQ